MSNRELFTKLYEQKLAAAVARHPDEYHYTAEAVPGVVATMVAALAEKKANVEAISRATAIACGIRPTANAIAAFLTTEGSL